MASHSFVAVSRPSRSACTRRVTIGISLGASDDASASFSTFFSSCSTSRPSWSRWPMTTALRWFFRAFCNSSDRSWYCAMFNGQLYVTVTIAKSSLDMR